MTIILFVAMQLLKPQASVLMVLKDMSYAAEILKGIRTNALLNG